MILTPTAFELSQPYSPPPGHPTGPFYWGLSVVALVTVGYTYKSASARFFDFRTIIFLKPLPFRTVDS